MSELRSKEVPVGVELAQITEDLVWEEDLAGRNLPRSVWRWQTPDGYEPKLKMLITKTDREIRRNGRIVINNATLFIEEPSMEYRLNVSITQPEHSDDPYAASFAEAFQAYQLREGILD
ncbi:MAG TPA: hypothetical protein VJC09_00270 [Candidatus Saccharimonadales bacterium]|nr:hypothetical protein [Candidatus Saccharimonadales bacterium]